MAEEDSGDDVGMFDVAELVPPATAETLADLPEEEAEQDPTLRTAIGFVLLRLHPNIDFRHVDFMFSKVPIGGKIRLIVVLGLTTVGFAWIIRKKLKRAQKRREQEESL